MSRRREERGAATVFAATACAALLVLGIALAEIVGLVAAHRRAQAAADLAALAAASAHDCAAASAIAQEHAARVMQCVLGTDDVRVSVVVQAAHWLGRGVSLQADARAGRAPPE